MRDDPTMRLNPPAEPIDDDDATIRAALVATNRIPMLAAVAQVTGELDILRDDLRPDLGIPFDKTYGLSEAQHAEILDLATAALARFRDRGSIPAPLPEGPALHRIMEYLAGGPVADTYVPLLTEELALGGADLRAPRWHKDEVAPDRPFSVGIIGAGMSGILVAHRLAQAGVPCTLYEKNAEVGGTWFENAYPGCRVDIANHFYSYACAQTSDWPSFYSTQAVLLDYFRTCADEFGVRERIRFGTEVAEAVWDDDRCVWTLLLRTSEGSRTVEHQAVVSAVGQLNRPKLPDIAGIGDFAGPWFHSARWDDEVDMAHRRVAVVGTGASAAQFIPHLADRAAHLTVFQRTPPWLFPVEDYMDDLPDGVRWLLRHLPEYARWDRLWVFWRTHEGLLPFATADPDWEHPDRSVSAANDLVREAVTEYFTASFPDPALLDKALPRYPPISKRVVLDNGLYVSTLNRPDVELVTEPIERVTPAGIVTADGRERSFDVIVYGTGFAASEFLTPMAVSGAGGADLHERWDGDARAYLGVVVPGFPNLFLMYGPNTNIVINGSIIYFSECEAHYIVESVRMLLERGAGAMDCRVEVHDAYNRRIDEGNQRMAWGVAGVNTWYRNAHGRISQNWPFPLVGFWQQTREPDPDDYVLT
jgi:4-hydroxyacetophenone monooxygenase